MGNKLISQISEYILKRPHLMGNLNCQVDKSASLMEAEIGTSFYSTTITSATILNRNRLAEKRFAFYG